jgi:hypothetical protein
VEPQIAFLVGVLPPLFPFDDHGDCLAAKRRPGNVSSSDDWEELLLPKIDRQLAEGRRVAFRADAAFARPAIYELAYNLGNLWRRLACRRGSTRGGRRIWALPLPAG